jgi:hypothetical protein
MMATIARGPLLGLFSLALILGARLSMAATIRVPVDQPTIQNGIDAASDGDTVLVAAGTYAGPGNRDVDFQGKGLIVRSESGPDATTLDCERHGRGFVFTTGENEHAVLEGFRVMNGTTGEPMSGAGLVCVAASPRIINCVFVDNHASGGFGGAAYCERSSVSFTQCIFAGNSALNHGGALFFRSSSPTIEGCTFTANFGIRGGAIAIGGSVATVSRCVFAGNEAIRGAAIYLAGASMSAMECTFAGNRNGLYLFNSSHATVSKSIIAFSHQGAAAVCAIESSANLDCCDVFGNVGGDWTECLSEQSGKRGNFSADPLFCDRAQGNLSLAGNSPCLVGNHPQGEPCGLIGALPQGCPPLAVESATWGAIKARWQLRR